MAELNLDLGDIQQVPKADLDRLHPSIRARCGLWKTQTIAYALIAIFTELAGAAEIREIKALSDSMGGIDMELRLAHGPCSLEMVYVQSVNESWQRVEVDRFDRSASLPGGVSFTWDLNLAGGGSLQILIDGLSDGSAGAIRVILGRCFASVEPRGAGERRCVAGLDLQDAPAPDCAPPHQIPEGPFPTGLQSLIDVFDKDRNTYMEWHDGPDLHEVNSAVARLSDGERADASRIVTERIKKSWDPYLGRAAELLGTEECRAALVSALASPSSAYTASGIARNLLSMGKSAEAVAALQAIVANTRYDWSVRINALVNLKAALDSAGQRRPLSEIITPELEAAIFDAVRDDEYLVRYHAAESILKAWGDLQDMTEHRELFGCICGKYPTKIKPDDEDRAGFQKAVDMIREMVRNPPPKRRKRRK